MKFLLIVLAVHFAVQMIGNKQNKKDNKPEVNSNVRHPAEHELR